MYAHGATHKRIAAAGCKYYIAYRCIKSSDVQHAAHRRAYVCYGATIATGCVLSYLAVMMTSDLLPHHLVDQSLSDLQDNNKFIVTTTVNMPNFYMREIKGASLRDLK